MIRSQIRDIVRKRLGETTASFWSDAELNGWIDLAGHDVADKAKCIKTTGYLTTVVSTREYSDTTLTGLLGILEVYMYQDGSKWVKLDKTARERLNLTMTGWRNAEDGVPQKYYYSSEERVVGLYPTPNTLNSGTNYLQVYYAKDYTDMTSDAATPTYIPTELQFAMTDYVCALAYETRGWGDKSNDAWSKYYSRIQAYLVNLDKENEDDETDVVINYRNR